MRALTVSAIQVTAADSRKAETVERVLAALDEAGRRGSQLVVLPEMWTGVGFSRPGAYREIAEGVPGPTTDALAAKAREHGLTIVGSLYERRGERYFNSAPVIGPDGSILGRYDKTHLFDAPDRDDIPPGFRESDNVEAGDELPVFETPAATIGVSVCSDLRFPEVYRELALKGAEVVLVASAFLSPRHDHWEFFLRARATENQCWVVASGQVGKDPESDLAYVGRSMVVDPWGVIVAQAPDTEHVLTTTIDLDHIERVRRHYPLLRQRRPELYGSIGRPRP